MQKSGALDDKPNSFNGLHAPNRLGALGALRRTHSLFIFGQIPVYLHREP
jgi:hypothetical protein